jgi:hypothetical protein
VLNKVTGIEPNTYKADYRQDNSYKDIYKNSYQQLSNEDNSGYRKNGREEMKGQSKIINPKL